MEWIDYTAKGIGFLVALGTFTKLAIEIYKAIKNGFDFKNWFSYRRKVKGLKYLRIFQKRGSLGFRNETSNLVKQQLTREIAKDIVHSYSLERRVSRFSRSDREVVKVLFTMFIQFVVLTCIAVLLNITDATPAQQKFIDAGTYALWWCFAGAVGISILQLIIALSRAREEFRSMVETSRLNVVQVPIESIPYCVEKDKDYIFVDATIRKRYQVPFMGSADGVQMLLDHGVAIDEVATLEKSEAKQIKADGYDQVAGQLVDSFLSKASIRDNESVFFVFSQAGITAVLVTQLLRSKGLRAFYIGATNGYESEVRETIREIRILRDSGLI